jgi:imidazole glycerol-phosphate synthase subunit HisH
MRIAILDYGMGNLRSAEKALERVGAKVERTTDPGAAEGADGLVLPGVGAFPEAMRRIRKAGFDTVAAESAAAGTPVLGICLGMQLLFDSSSEGEGAEGLGLIPGDVVPLSADGLKVPHIGWSPVRWERDAAITEGLGPEPPFYFVHSFTPAPAEEADVLGTAAYGDRFACAVARENVFGLQFHPEKSSAAGLALLKNFIAICENGADGEPA